MEAALSEADLDAIVTGAMSSPLPLKVIRGLLRHKDDLTAEHYRVVWCDEKCNEAWVAKVVNYSAGGFVYHVRLC